MYRRAFTEEGAGGPPGRGFLPLKLTAATAQKGPREGVEL